MAVFERWTSPMLAYPTSATLALLVFCIALATTVVRYVALPRPIPGIPYTHSSAKNIFGDIPAMMKHITHENGTFITYIVRTVRQLNAPLVQIFIRPFSPPLLVLADFREAQNLMTRRKDFDRSSSSGDLVKALAPEHHIHLKTGPAFWTQRRLIQDLMTPAFLHNVAGPAIYDRTKVMIDLWHERARIAGERPWTASKDIDHVALDAVVAFAFGENFSHSATLPELESLRSLDEITTQRLRDKEVGDGDIANDPFPFPTVELDRTLQAVLDVTATVQQVQGSPLPDLKWWYVLRKPDVKLAMRIKEECIDKQLREAVNRMSLPSSVKIRSAVDHMVQKEKSLAEKEGRAPNYFSRTVVDEIFGFVVAGHDTTGATICWGLKYLAENESVQTILRDTLRSTFSAAVNEERAPQIHEITAQHIPYLSAFLEEVLRCAGTVPIVDRQALVDTQVLGYDIPRGTVISSLVTGPSMTSQGFQIDEKRRGAEDVTHSAPRMWHAGDEASFRPERWLVPESEDYDGSSGPQLAFGLGTRQCYGKRLANLELKIILTIIVWNFVLLPCAPELSGHHPILVMTSRPKDCFVRLRPV